MKRYFALIAAVLAALALSSILVAAADGQTAGKVYAIPGDLNRGWLGVSVQDVTKSLAESKKLKASAGAYVSDVVEDSPAEKAGLLKGDVIVKFNGGSVGDRDDLITAVRRTDPGDTVTLVVDRKGEKKTLSATLDEPAAPRAYVLKVPDVPAVAPFPLHPPGWSFFMGGPRLGMEMQTLGKQLAEFLEVPGNRGVLIGAVEKKGAAADAGLKAGDVIVRVNRNAVRDVDDVLEEVGDADRDTVAFEVVRKGKPLTFAVPVAGEREKTSGLDWLRREGYHYQPGREGYLDALEELRENDVVREDLGRELRESIRELKRNLKEGARELKHEINRSWGDS